jgi:chemotaxis protein histidine kinase CheA
MDVREEKCEPGLEEFLGEFLRDRQSETTQLKSLLSEQAKAEEEVREELRKVGHRWKGFAAPYGFHGLIELSHEISSLNENFDCDKAQNILTRVDEYLNEKESQLKREGHV